MARPTFSNPRAGEALGRWVLLVVFGVGGCANFSTPPHAPRSPEAAASGARSCFLLHEVGVGRVVREPAEGCSVRVTPASTFKIPHALAALDAGVVRADEVFRYDGKPWQHASYRQDQTLTSAIRHSVLWYFQELADRLGAEREIAYLETLRYGNADISSGLRSFWLYESLRISPEEQETFLLRLYGDDLPVSQSSQELVRAALVQPAGVVVNATGAHPFGQPWPEGTVVSAKTGGGAQPDLPDVRWLVGHVRRGPRAWIFVSNVVGHRLPPLAAVELAATSLKRTGVL
ncbi:MAG TPA: penicillin-binding transpeptidase domain-containing protein [Polyangia bacterium]